MVLSSSAGLLTVVRAADEGVPSGGTLRIGWLQEQDTLNPFVTNTVQGRMMQKEIYDTLLMWNKELVPTASLASSWTTSSDGLEWTFNLVQNATWSDGQALKASDVKFTFDMIKTLDLSAFRDQVKFISNVTTSGDYQVVVTYSGPVGTITSDMCLVPILPEHIWTGMNKSQALAATNEAPVGSGPFELTSWVKGTSVELTANKDYWGGAPHVDKVVFQFYANSEAMINALRNNEIDMIPKELPPTSISVLNQDENVKVATNVDLYYREISINCDATGQGNPTLRDVHVRQALSMAVDKSMLVDLVQLGSAEPGSTIVQKAASAWWNADEPLMEFNISAANKLLNDSGYLDYDDNGIRDSPDHATEMSYTLLVLARWPEEMRTGQQIQTWWQQIGVKLTVQSADANTINSYVYPDYKQDMFLWGYSGQPDPSFSLMIMLSNQIGDWNDCGYANASYDALYDEQATTVSVDERQAIVNEMQDIVYKDAPYIVLYYMTAKGAYRIDTFAGFVNMPTGLLSDVNRFTLREVHLITAGTTAKKTDYTPWAIAAAAIIVALVAIVYAMMRRGGGKGANPRAEQRPEPPLKK
jgi:peptide/nickel transport system substrate-binding protein